MPAQVKHITQVYQDQVIANALPQWLRSATHEQLQLLRSAMASSLKARERCAEILARIETVPAFCEPLLQQALGRQLPHVDSARVRFRLGRKEPVITSQPVGYPVSHAVYTEIALLEAALRNFSAEQTQAGKQLAGNRLIGPADPQPALPSAQRFAAFCRQLDLGGQYQAHLSQILEPAGAAGRQVRDDLAEHLRLGLLVDAHQAWAGKALDVEEHRLLVALCDGVQPLKLRGDPVQCKQLELLGTVLEQIVVLDVRDESWSPLYTSSRRVIVHIPGDPQAPLRAYPTLRHFANDLGKRLRTAEYQRFFSRFVRRRDSQRFFSAVIEGYSGVSDLANIALQEHMRSWSTPLFSALARARIAQIKDDAALIATPAAQIDRDVQREHDQRLASEGWALLNLAGLFVPGLGLGLLGVAAWQLLGEVYHGVQAWREGDRSAALDHLYNVADDVLSVAASGVAIGVAQQLWSRAAVVDALLPVTLDDGRVRLWKADLAAYRQTALPADAQPDAQGLYRSGGRTWVRMDDACYPVANSEQTPLRLLPRDGLAPELQGNGAGAWRLRSEQPAHWQGSSYLFRRLALTQVALDDEQIGQILTATATSEDQLRGLHVRAEAADALLLDTTSRFALEQRIRTQVGRLRSGLPYTDHALLAHARAMPGAAGLDDQALAEHIWRKRRGLFSSFYASTQDPDSAASAMLRRAFPSLHRRSAEQLLGRLNAQQQAQMLQSGRIPMDTAAAARAAARRIRVARVFEGFYLDVPQSLDLSRVSLTLASRLPGAPQGLCWRLYEGTRQATPVLIGDALSGGRQLDLLHREGAFQVHDQRGQLLAEHDDLFEAIALAFDDSARNAVGVAEPFAHNLRVLLGRMAARQPEQVSQALGLARPAAWLRLPQRLQDGRVGYPLSGRGTGRPQGLYARVRALYPGYTELEIELWAHEIYATGQSLDAHLQSLQAELTLLRSTLERWAGDTAQASVAADRRAFNAVLVRAWRRVGAAAPVADVDVMGYRFTVQGLELPALPELPAGIHFEHIHELALRDMNIQVLPDSFLRAFGRLRVLQLSGNRLERVPPVLPALEHLRHVDLRQNSIVLDDAQAAVLEQCASLDYLNLSVNPLRRSFSVERMSLLRNLNLRQTELPELPVGLLGRMDMGLADLRDNRIQTLPQAWFEYPLWVTSSILLDDNPLDVQVLQRMDARLQAQGWLSDVPETEEDGGRDRWLDALPDARRIAHGQLWDDLEQQEGSGDFFDLLRRLLDTADFSQHGEVLAPRLFAMLEAMREHASLREELFELASVSLTCHDSTALNFSELEQRLLIWRVRQDAGGEGEQAALLHLGRQFWRQEQVDRIVDQEILERQAQGRDADQLEVSLAYRIGLRESLDLPPQPEHMLYDEIARVDAAALEQARQQVLALETNQQLAQWLAARSFWEAYVERSHGELLRNASAPFQERLEALIQAAEAGGQEAEYLDQLPALQREQQQARQAVLARLALTALDALTDAEAAGSSGQGN